MSEQKDIDQRLKLVEEALNDFWFEQDERMIVRHRRLAEKIESDLRLALVKERETTVDFINNRIHDSRVYELEHRMSELEEKFESTLPNIMDLRGIAKPTPEATLCPSVGLPDAVYPYDPDYMKCLNCDGEGFVQKEKGSQPKATPCKHTGQRVKSEVISCVDCGEVIGQYDFAADSQPEAKPNPDGLDYLRKAYKDNHPARSALER